ncbi:DnaD domain protein [Lactobacillus salivarius]|uniref:helix-turn-helix domain-containing protein n=1 Tax=Ligilactobacillus salivarius TaxID=1624 RepID=UPI0013C90332|nr:helix-turn-helix domain-containing protein [Ligilactobacillus salivarius]NGG72710.1 DnaD domain protein [Ligilactobacillus salivarius]
MEEKPSYYSILTANVRYDRRLKANEKLLFSEITALSNKYGYCTATNSYFSKLYEVSRTSISTWINNLKRCGYLEIETIYKDNSKEIIQRKMYPQTNPIKENLNRYSRKVTGGIKENLKTPIKENFKDNNININNININSSSNKESSSEEQINAFTAYQMTGASLTGRQQPILVDYVDRLGHELVVHAIEYMEDHTKRPNFSYLRVILNGYEDNHITTVEDAIKNEERFKEHRQKQKNKQNKKKSMFMDAKDQDYSKSAEEEWEAFWNG